MKEIEINDENYNRLQKEREDFEKTINGKEWSIDDTLNELFKILDSIKNKEQNERK